MQCLVVNPSGRLVVADIQRPDGILFAESLPPSAARAFGESSAEGLLHLATMRSTENVSAVLAFWRRFGELYLTALCHTPQFSIALSDPLPPPSDDLAALAQAAPPMIGGEYLRVETMQAMWAMLDDHVRAEITRHGGGTASWLRSRSQLWHCVGRVSFHLAENKRDPDCPFAFLATYARKLTTGLKVQYQPLGKALTEYAGAQNHKTLVNLLTPVQRAAEKCNWVKAMVDSGEIFHPLRWKPAEAYQFLKDIPLLEDSGLLVRVPDWWSKRPPRVQVSVSVGEKKRNVLTADSMLDFHVRLAVGDEQLSDEEWQALLAGSDGLVFLKGRWVEIDRERLAGALEHWKGAEEAAAGDGISFIEGMRLLAGASVDGDGADEQAAARAAWSEVQAGPWLQERLRELREPCAADAALPGGSLKADLRPYQKTGVTWLRFLQQMGLGACLADDMGLGKTIQVIALLLTMKQNRRDERPAPTLLVLPASLLANWKAEFERFAPSLVIRFAHPSQTPAAELQKAAESPQAFVEGADAVLTTYGMLLRQKWLHAPNWSLAVLDEAQAIKNPAARQTRAVKRLKAAARVVLTGTPVENRLSDLWSIFDFLCPGLLGSAKEFGNFIKHLEQHERDQYAPLRRLVSPYILRRMKTDKRIIADLPDKTEVQAFCNLTKRQAVLYEQAVDELADALESVGGIQRRGIILSFILRFKQICNHPAQWLASGEYLPDESGKYLRLRELCEEIVERQEKMLVFTQFREMTQPIANHLAGIFGRPGLVLHGQVAVGKRKKLVDDFQREDGPPFFVLSLKAGGTGLNLTAASHVVHFDRWWNPAVENQATDRAFRIGQEKNVMVHKFVCRGTIEEKIDALIRDKADLADQILEHGVPGLITEMDNDALLDLVRLDLTSIEED
ncbi:MAG TPA: DEAD/DEAH box helicase [Planctomycetota bacterium]|nr:DEAD/DEAH box helicase [Planctomycetota bacterium]